MGKFSNFWFSQNYRFQLVVNQCLAQSGPAHCAGTVTVLAQWSKFPAQYLKNPVQHSLAQSGSAQWTTLIWTTKKPKPVTIIPNQVVSSKVVIACKM